MSKLILEKTQRLNKEGFNCAESVLMTAASEWKIQSKIIPRIATGFGGGIGRQGYICGALSGGVIALGLKYGRDKADKTQARDKTYMLIRELFRQFKEEFGSISCYELIECDLSTLEGLKKLKKVHSEKCGKFIARTAELVLEMAAQK